MPFMLVEAPRYLLRQELLGSEALYEVVEEGDEIVTAEVVSVPGLPRGMRVDLLARAARQMERRELTDPRITLEPGASAEPPAPRRAIRTAGCLLSADTHRVASTG
jgi:hypothetical protein